MQPYLSDIYEELYQNPLDLHLQLIIEIYPCERIEQSFWYVTKKGAFCVKLNSTGYIKECEMFASSQTADFYAKLVVEAYQLRCRTAFVGWNRPKLKRF